MPISIYQYQSEHQYQHLHQYQYQHHIDSNKDLGWQHLAAIWDHLAASGSIWEHLAAEHISHSFRTVVHYFVYSINELHYSVSQRH